MVTFEEMNIEPPKRNIFQIVVYVMQAEKQKRFIL